MIHHLVNPQVLLHPALLPWVRRALFDTGYAVSVAPYLAELCARPYAQVLLGIENGRPVALLVTELALQPTILLGYNEGSKAIGARMFAEAAQWLRSRGFSRVTMTNSSMNSDAAYERGLRPHGRVISKVTTFGFELKELKEWAPE